MIIDLASGKGGTDFEYAEKLGLKAILAPGLPGKYFPKKAVLIIKDTITKMIKEDNL